MFSSIREWVSVTFATVAYEKKFVSGPDASEKDQEHYGRRARELKDRALQLHLDELEERYLCCICGASGEARESDEHIYDTFSTVHLPPVEEISASLRGHQLASETKAFHANAPSFSSFLPEGDDCSSGGEDLATLESKVSPFEVEHMMYKIRHAVLNNENRTKRRAVAIHRDKGLLMIDDDEVDTFTRLFRRPVKGYLCETCYDSAKRRLELLQQEIEGVLFKADHPFLKRTSKHELQLLYASGQLSRGVLEEILRLKKQNYSVETPPSQQGVVSHGHSPSTASAKSFSFFTSDPCGFPTLAEERKIALTDSCIGTLRSLVKCGVCESRLCRFFIRSSVLFLCQFCCARDRFYRENGICINDEALPLDIAHLLTALAKHYERVRQQDSVHKLPVGHLETAPTSLFGISESLFRSQNNLALKTSSSPEGTEGVISFPLAAHASTTTTSTFLGTSHNVSPIAAPLEPPHIQVPDTAPGSSIQLFLNSRPSLFIQVPEPFHE